MRLASAQLEELADLIADRLGGADAREERLVDVAELAGYLGVDASWVYAHADELGARRLGEGSRPRLRFSIREVDDRLSGCSAGRRSAGVDPAPAVASRPRRRRRSGSEVDLLPIRGSA